MADKQSTKPPAISKEKAAVVGAGLLLLWSKLARAKGGPVPEITSVELEIVQPVEP